MDESVKKILDEKDENLVQFNVTNITSNPVFLNLFSTFTLSVIPTSPSYSYSPNSVIGNTGIGSPMNYITLANNGLIYASDIFSNDIVIINPTTNLTIGSIPLGDDFSGWITYNPINNTLYNNSITNIVTCIDCNTNTILTTIVVISPNQSAFNSQQNTLYATTSTNIVVIDCNTNTIITTIPVISNYIAYNSTNNLIYTTTSASNDISIIDCATNTLIGVLTFNLPTILFYISSTNTLYFGNNGGTELGILDCATNTLISSTIIPVITGLLESASLDTNLGNVYFGTSLGYTIILSTTTNLITNYLFIASSTISSSVFINTTNEIYFATPSLNTLTILTTQAILGFPYYISGSSNYNAFVNNLNNEPIFISMIRLFVLNQNQLNNQLQLTKIDMNGNQIFMPNFPINQVSPFQDQPNIGEIEFKEIVFDGSTYINQYQLNANESISFEIYYKQLDLTSATNTYPIFFKPKVQLKNYIKKDYNNYDV
jgi:hypothetical protein